MTADGLRILVGDDEPQIRSIIRDSLVLSGWTVDLAADGREVLQRYRDTSYALLIVDFLMPGRTGLDVVAELRGQGDRVPIILMDGAPRGERMEASALNYRVELLRKPFRLGDLRSAVRRSCHPENC